jgi:MFS family permease
MKLNQLLLMQLFNHTCFRGSKVLLTLFALKLGASPVMAGLAFAMYSLLPTFLSVFAGRLTDRIGYRLPMLVGSAGLFAGMLLPFFWPTLPMLFVSATLCGTCYIFYTVSVQSLVGAIGDTSSRTRNYSLYALIVGFTALFGPVFAGFAIEYLGGSKTYLLMAFLPLIPVLMLILIKGEYPAAPSRGANGVRSGAWELLRNPRLRSILVVAGVLETGNELGNFLIPIYGNHIGLPPSQIGMVMGALAAALLIVRFALPMLVRRSSESSVLIASMSVAAVACVLFPFSQTFWPLAGTAFLMGIGIGCGPPLSMTLVYNRSPQDRTGEAMGLRQTVNKGTEVVVPVVFGSMSAGLGMLPVFWSVAALLILGAYLMRRDARAEV